MNSSVKASCEIRGSGTAGKIKTKSMLSESSETMSRTYPQAEVPGMDDGKKEMTKNELVYQTCLLLVQHFKNLLNAGGVGFNSRIFEYMLHWEYDFVGIGQSTSVTEETLTSDIHPEHVVPCAFMIKEVCRLIKEGHLIDTEIAALLQKHWKIAKITKKEAKRLDSSFEGIGHKSTMPPEWRFETGATLARLIEGQITLISVTEP